MTKDTPKLPIMHQFDVHAAQAAEDKLSMQEKGFFTPDVYFPNNPEGLWAAQELNRYIKKMGYDSEIALDSVDVNGRGLCQVLNVGKIPQAFLEDIKDFLTMREAQQQKGSLALFIVENGHHKVTHQTTMMAAFENMNNGRARGKSGGNGGIPVKRYAP